jgi:RNA polymerase sigma-70 factor (ECF subfamily)
MFLESNSSSPAEVVGLEHIDSLYSYALVLTRNRTDAEDLVQETYVRALKAMVRLKAESNVKSWLFTILRNIWLNQLRHRRTAPQLVEMDLDGSTDGISVEASHNPHAIYVSEMERNLVCGAIQRLPPAFREVILLREYEELSYQEIATILECPIGTVMSRLARARSKLRILLRTAELRARSKGDAN